ncbi:Gfo/Idh/MocA family protein [Paenibacillus lignilyticus]|uniref:Gfo/Idh/MocA family oxidoreductase n=1 Tax=Paenibacillus lignilyticus TaxID=1172615 RepID=A0ABS5C6Z1_9BACL|nr:Gfo/Idh/MocA family oxidoreductase [Paenibacillus lignilyticus]MBP3961747.1 Gfo/Idh/MocA family oxidoreductase [Paenibacillus lignilyticus]MBP3963582.1 Gfo/Idh/MocA family oxidoreductase [Paenibacillus lignilyticus]
MWKVGLIGTGFWSDKHLQAWSRIPGVQITALCNRSPEKLMKAASKYNISSDQLYSHIDDMLAHADVDIIDIVTGAETHVDFVRKAAQAGKHIMCQKPFAPTMEEAEEMVSLAKRNGVRLMVTENWRWLEPFQTIKEVIDSGELGKLHVARYVHTDYYTPRMEPEAELPQPFFRTMPKLLFYEMGVHWFDTWRFLFGTPQRLTAELTRVSNHIIGEDSGIVMLGHEGFYGFMDMSWATRQKLDRPLGEQVKAVHLEQFVIDGSNGSLKMYTDGKITVVSKDGASERVVKDETTLDHEESHFRLQSHFIACLSNGEPFQTSGEDNLITLRLAFSVYESAAEHKTIAIT